MSKYTVNLHLTQQRFQMSVHHYVLLFTIFIIVVTQKLVLQQSKNVTAVYGTLSPPPSIQFSLNNTKLSVLEPLNTVLKSLMRIQILDPHCKNGSGY